MSSLDTQARHDHGDQTRKITPAIAILAQQFPATFPADPHDRLIAATAIAEDVPLVTADDEIRARPLVRMVW